MREQQWRLLAERICTNSTGSFSCACNSGYTGDGIILDIDECATNHGGCSSDAACTNTGGSFTVQLQFGLRGHGLTCSDINECVTNYGGCSGTCTNTVGAYTCSCATGLS